MKTEREFFEDWLKKEYPMIHQWYSDGLEEWKTKVEYMFVAWQARVPEGYAVVPKLPTENMINSGLETECGIDDWTIIHDIYQSMIEAVEK